MQNSTVLSRATPKTNGRNVVAKAAVSKKNEPAKGQPNKPPIKRIPIAKKSSLGLSSSNNNNNNNNNKININSNTSSNTNDTSSTNDETNNTNITTNNSNHSITNSITDITNNTNTNNNNKNINSESKTLISSKSVSPNLGLTVDSVTSATSFVSRRTDVDSEDAQPKAKTKFTRPRMNQLTEQRINRLRASAADGANVLPVVRSHSEAPTQHLKRKCDESHSQTLVCLQLQRNGIEPIPCPQPLETLQRQLEDMQSMFMKKVAGFRGKGHGYSYKLVTIVHNDNCKVLVHSDDLLALPRNLPAHSVNDFRALLHETFKNGCMFIFEQFAAVQSGGNDVVIVCREELRNKLDGHLDNKLAIVDHELMEMVRSADNDETAKLMRQICELSETNTNLRTTNTKLDLEVADIRKSREELKKALDVSQKRNNDLALELADKNILLVEQTSGLEDLKAELKQVKKSNANSNKVLQQRLKESESSIESFQHSNDELLTRIEDLETKVFQAQSECLLLQKKMDELMQDLAEKETLIAEQRAQLQDSDLTKTLQSESSSNEPEAEHICELQAELERQKMLLTEQQQTEQTLRTELEQKQDELNKAELKLSRLEEQNEHHRQVLAVRSERINYLDKEMKQREQESNRKINEIMAQTSDKNTLITQISNELAATTEQFNNLCSTLSTKQTKLHSQEHVIKLLEESNARSVKLHTKLGEKNAMLKDELEHLRRTVSSILSRRRNNLMLGNDVNDADVADILLE